MLLHNALLFLLSVICVCARADGIDDALSDPQSTWEFGAAGGGFHAPDYPGADHRSSRGLAVPYLIYRGETLRVGDGSIVKGVLVEEQKFEFDLSLDASFNADSSDNPTRAGMPDLDYLVEIGPQLIYKPGQLWGGKVKLELPLRAALSTDFSGIDERGYVFNPEISWLRRDWKPELDLYAGFGSSFASSKLHRYFYQVDPEFVTPTRQAYRASGGYVGSELTLGLVYRPRPQLRFFFGTQIGLLQGAANTDSPLLRDRSTLAVAAGFRWILYQSED